jgi:predicted PurR-regulated permease PerM
MGKARPAVRGDDRGHAVLAVSASGEWQTAIRRRSDVRTVALVIIAGVAVCVAIHSAAAFLIPIVVSLVASYALSPVVDQLHRLHIPRSIGAAVVVVLLIVGGALGVQRLWNGAEAVLGQLPAAMEKIRLAIAVSQSDVPNSLTHVQRTANELGLLAGASPSAAENGAPKTAGSTLDARSLLLMGTSSAVAGIVQLWSIVFLTYFLLAAGDLFRRKLVHLVGPPIARQKATLEVLNHIHELNRRYLAVLAFVNVGVGVTTAAGLGLIGLEHAAIWGIAIAVLHFVPYLGAALVISGVALAGYLQFGTPQMALVAAAIPFASAVLIGVLLQAALLGRAASMNAPVVFIALLFWAMLWGAWGLLLAMPIMVALKSICDRVESLSGLGELLGDNEKAVLR